MGEHEPTNIAAVAGRNSYKMVTTPATKVTFIT